jgi:hypothetical protein
MTLDAMKVYGFVCLKKMEKLSNPPTNAIWIGNMMIVYWHWGYTIFR